MQVTGFGYSRPKPRTYFGLRKYIWILTTLKTMTKTAKIAQNMIHNNIISGSNKITTRSILTTSKVP